MIARSEPAGEWPEIRVSCDSLGCTERLYVIANVARDFDVAAALLEDGWEDRGDDTHVCPKCARRQSPSGSDDEWAVRSGKVPALSGQPRPVDDLRARCALLVQRWRQAGGEREQCAIDLEEVLEETEVKI